MFKLTKLINWRNHIIKHLKKKGLIGIQILSDERCDFRYSYQTSTQTGI